MFKVAGPLWAQATAGGDNIFARLVKTGKKVLRRVLQTEVESVARKDIPKPTWSLHAQAIQVSESSSRRLIGGLFPKKALQTQAAEARRRAALRLIRDSGKVPVFAFVGLTLGTSLDRKKGETEDVLYSGIRGLFQQYGRKESDIVESGHHFSLETLQLGQLIGKGCNAAVYEARSAAKCCDQDTGTEDTSSSSHADPSDSGIQQADILGSSVDAAEESPPTIFHTDDHFASAAESDDDDDDDDDDFCIISEDEAETADPKTISNTKLDGWVFYRVSFADATASDVSDSESDIFILAGDEDGLESVPDQEDLELGWTIIDTQPPDVEAISHVIAASTDSGTDSTMTTDLSTGTSLSSELTNFSVTTDDPEPAPNIHGSGDYPLAVKMMFNYNVESQADRILSAMAKETVPAQSSLTESVARVISQQAGMRKLPPHPNIVTMHGVFVDQTPDLPGGAEAYPSALPPRLNKEGGFGRNSTMFLVMKKYTMTLREYLGAHSVNTHTRCLLLAQLLEGVAHLENHGIAHRDLKSDNILVDLSHRSDLPLLVISDFGCCLADETYGLKLPYLTREMDKGGNCAMMAPEIKCAEPGRNSVLDYTKADLWAAGALAYEIFGEENPFYGQLDARYYSEEDLPSLPADVPGAVLQLIESLLKRDPSERPTPAVAATAMQLLLWAPTQLQPFAKQGPIGYNALWRCKELCHWLEQLTLETVCQRVFGGGTSPLDLLVKTSFLSRVTQQDVLAVAAFD